MPRPTSQPRSPAPASGAAATLSAADTDRLYRAADFFARGLVRGLGLNRDEGRDLRQEIVLRVLERLGRFDPERGPFGAFVDLVAKRAAQRLQLSAIRNRRTIRVDPRVMEGDWGPACLTDPGFAAAEFHHDLRSVLSRAPADLSGVCTAPDRRPPMSRSTFYRRRLGLRLWLLANGIGPASRNTVPRP